MKKEPTYINRVTMEGCVTDIGLDKNRACLTVCTRADGTDEGTVCHRVSVLWDGPTPECFREARKTCLANATALLEDTDLSSLFPVWARLEGRLAKDADGDCTECRAEDVQITFVRGAMHAEIEARGRLVAKAGNDLCAAAAIDAGVNISMNVLKSENPGKWEELRSDRTLREDAIAFTAPLTSAYMTNGQDGHWQCRAIAGTYRNLSLEKREARERKKDTGVRMTS